MAARYSYLDLNSGTVNGGTMHITMLGLNWYWNRYVRWMFKIGHANVREDYYWNSIFSRRGCTWCIKGCEPLPHAGEGFKAGQLE